MKRCSGCGDDIEDTALRCPRCESKPTPVAGEGGARTKRSSVSTVNLKLDLPTVAEALASLEGELAGAALAGIRVVRVIHGYGSSGVGGAIKAELHRRLPGWRDRGLVRGFVHGEDYRERSEGGRRLLSACPELRESLREDRGNPGITLIEPGVRRGR